MGLPLQRPDRRCKGRRSVVSRLRCRLIKLFMTKELIWATAVASAKAAHEKMMSRCETDFTFAYYANDDWDLRSRGTWY